MKDEDRRQAKRDCKFSDEPRNWRALAAIMILDGRQSRYDAITWRHHRAFFFRYYRIALHFAWTLRIASTQRREAPLP